MLGESSGVAELPRRARALVFRQKFVSDFLRLILENPQMWLCAINICLMCYMNDFELPWFLDMNCGYWKYDWMIYGNISYEYFKLYMNYWYMKAIYVSHNLKRFKKRKD